MKPESERYLGLLEKRLSLLEALSKTLAACRTDFIAMDLESMQSRIQEQESFCSEIQNLDKHITNAQIRYANLAGISPRTSEIFWPGAAGPDHGFGDRIRETMRRVAAAQSELKRLNDAHQAMLRRSRSTVGVLLNFLQSHAPSYSVPPTRQTGTLCEERV
jgi:hypothetical protein